MADLPARPPTGLPALPPGWTEHKAPAGHTYYYHKGTKKSTYIRPVAEARDYSHASPTAPIHAAPPPAPAFANPNADLFNPLAANNTINPPQQYPNFQFGGGNQGNWSHVGPPRGGFRGGHRGGGQNTFPDRRRQPEDRPKHRHDIPDCAPWVLVTTKLKRRFVWNKDTNESFWKFPAEVMKGVVEFDRIQREKRERRERGELSDEEDAKAMAEVEADLAAAEAEMEGDTIEVEVEGEDEKQRDIDMASDEEYEEVEVTDDEEAFGSDDDHRPKRQRTEDPPPASEEDQGHEFGEDDMAWQLAEMEALEAAAASDYDSAEDLDEGLPLTEEDCKALFTELLDDLNISPYTPWDTVLSTGHLYADERYKALPNMKSRKETFDSWARHKASILQHQKSLQQKLDPRIPYLTFLHTHASPKLYWPEFRRKYKKEPEIKDVKVSDKEKEKLYRDHIKRLSLPSSTLKSELSSLLKAQPLSTLNKSSTLHTLPQAVLTDLRFISLPPSTRDALVETYISTLPPAPEGQGGGKSAEEEAEEEKRRVERERRERALREREKRVREDERRRERELEVGRGRLREGEEEIARAMRVGKGGLRGQLGDVE